MRDNDNDSDNNNNQNSQFPTQHQNDIANEPFAAATARQKWLQTRLSQPTKYRAPSWSWASSNLCITWLLDTTKWAIETRGSSHTTLAHTRFLTLLSANIAATPDPYGAVELEEEKEGYASLTVRGPLVRVHRRSVPLSGADREKISAVNFRPSPLSEAATPSSREVGSNVISQTAGKVNYHFIRTGTGTAPADRDQDRDRDRDRDGNKQGSNSKVLVFEYFHDDDDEEKVNPTIPPLQESEYKCLFTGWDATAPPCKRAHCGCKQGWSEEAFWCLRVSQVQLREDDSGDIRFLEGWLLLQRCSVVNGDGEGDVYKRVGVGYFDSSGTNRFGLFDGVQERVVQII